MRALLGTDIIGSWSFNPATKQITLSGGTFSLANILLIQNASRNNALIYNFADPTAAATAFSNNTITLAFDTTSHNAADILNIWIEVDPISPMVRPNRISVDDDNDYTQEILGGIHALLRSVWQMGSAAGAASITVRNSTAADLQVTANLNQLVGATPFTNSAANAPSNTGISTQQQLIVAQTQMYHLPILPQHIYANITAT